VSKRDEWLDIILLVSLGFALGAIVMLMTLAVSGVDLSTPQDGMHRAKVFCPNIAEDSAAHVTLVDYGHAGSTLVYQCERSGY
jgi:hypothetical protein